MLRIFLPIVIGLIVWIIVLWQVLLKKKKIDMKSLLLVSALFAQFGASFIGFYFVDFK